jgi:hypothetical protein
MRIALASASFVEAAVTVAVAVLMTVAGFEMVQDLGTQQASAMATRAHPRQAGEARATAPVTVAMPHVDAVYG